MRSVSQKRGIPLSIVQSYLKDSKATELPRLYTPFVCSVLPKAKLAFQQKWKKHHFILILDHLLSRKSMAIFRGSGSESDNVPMWYISRHSCRLHQAPQTNSRKSCPSVPFNLGRSKVRWSFSGPFPLVLKKKTSPLPEGREMIHSEKCQSFFGAEISLVAWNH